MSSFWGRRFKPRRRSSIGSIGTSKPQSSAKEQPPHPDAVEQSTKESCHQTVVDHSQPAPEIETTRITNQQLLSEAEGFSFDLERRLSVLCSCLEEKVEENSKLSADLSKLREQNQTLVAKLNNFENQLDEKDDLVEELQRRIEVLSVCLQDFARENLKFMENMENSLPSSRGIHRLELSEQLSKEYKILEETIGELRTENQQLKVKLVGAERKLKQLQTKYQRAEDRRQALIESNETYETEYQRLHDDMLTNLRQEAKRRKKAEKEVSRLKRKVAELEFELQEAGSGTSYSSSEEESEPSEQQPSESNGEVLETGSDDRQLQGHEDTQATAVG